MNRLRYIDGRRFLLKYISSKTLNNFVKSDFKCFFKHHTSMTTLFYTNFWYLMNLQFYLCVFLNLPTTCCTRKKIINHLCIKINPSSFTGNFGSVRSYQIQSNMWRAHLTNIAFSYLIQILIRCVYLTYLTRCLMIDLNNFT